MKNEQFDDFDTQIQCEEQEDIGQGQQLDESEVIELREAIEQNSR